MRPVSNNQALFGGVLFAIVMTQQAAAFCAFRVLRDEEIIDEITYAWMVGLAVVALISFLIVFVADVATLVLPVPLVCVYAEVPHG
jgi:phosphate/sulfate permease